MKLSNEQFKRFRELLAKVKAKKATPAEEKELEELTQLKKQTASNDLAWWKNYPELLKDVTNLPFNWIPGTGVTITGLAGASSTLDLGVIAMASLAPAIGRCQSDADAFNAQIRQLWLDMHRKYRGIGAYEKADLGIAILAINSLFETIAKFERIYGVINTYHIGNRVVPNGLKDALGISTNLESNLADFRYTLNLAIEKCKQLCLPKGLSVLTSDIVAISNLFKDSENRRAFIFGFDTDEFGTYNGSIVNTGGTAIGSALVYEAFGASYMSDSTPSGFAAFTLGDIQQILENQITALLSDDDIQLMCSDLLAAYGPENVMTLVSLPEDYKVEPVHDYERSVQFHNLVIVGQTSTIFNDAIVDNTLANNFNSNDQYHVFYQYNNMVQCRLGKGRGTYVLNSGYNYPTFGSTVNEEHAKMGEILFDTWVDQPGETEIMCGTRYSSLGGNNTVVATNQYRAEVYDFGTKVVEQVAIFTYVTASRTYSSHAFRGTVVDSSFFNSNYGWYCAIAQMDWAPIFYVVDQNDTNLFGDLDNFTKISSDNLDRIHEVALLSGYKIPMTSRE